MNDVDDINSDSDALRMALRQLRRDMLPERDLWPQIAARITKAPVTANHPATRNRFVSWALAASLLLAVTLAWQLQPRMRQRSSQPISSTQNELIAHEARAMTRAYRGALQELTASAPAGIDTNPALRELDQSAAQIRGALVLDPDARFLLTRLRHTYALRLVLTQRVALT